MRLCPYERASSGSGYDYAILFYIAKRNNKKPLAQ
jgi:hypothetical protein